MQCQTQWGLSVESNVRAWMSEEFHLPRLGGVPALSAGPLFSKVVSLRYLFSTFFPGFAMWTKSSSRLTRLLYFSLFYPP